MAGIELLDGDDVEQPSGAGLVAPYALDAGKPRLLHLVPDHCRLHGAAGVGEVVGRPRRIGEAHDRVVAVVHPADLDGRLVRPVTGVVAHELAERPLGHQFVAVDLAFDGDFGAGRNGQAVDFGLHGFERKAPVAAGVVHLVGAPVDLVVGGEEQQRVLAEADHHRAGLALGEVLFADQPAVFAGRHPNAAGVLVLHHHPVGGGVDPVLLRVAGDHHVVGADVAPAVSFVDEGDRELVEVDLVVPVDVVEDRPAVLFLGRDQLEVGAQPVAARLDHVKGIPRFVEAEDIGQPAHGVGGARQHPEAVGEPLDFLEQQRRRPARGRVLAHHFGQRAHFQVPVRAFDPFELAHPVDALDQVAQILVPVLVASRPAPADGIIHDVSSPFRRPAGRNRTAARHPAYSIAIRTRAAPEIRPSPLDGPGGPT